MSYHETYRKTISKIMKCRLWQGLKFKDYFSTFLCWIGVVNSTLNLDQIFHAQPICLILNYVVYDLNVWVSFLPSCHIYFLYINDEYVFQICEFFFFLSSCHLLLGEVEKARQYFNKCLESGAGVCLDRRITIEAADGLQKAQVCYTDLSSLS